MEILINYSALGHRIQQARLGKNLTQAQLGELCSLSTAHIGHIERGTRTPSLETLCKIACTLEVSTDFLLLDSAQSKGGSLAHVEAILNKAGNPKSREFMNVIKILAANIDEF